MLLQKYDGSQPHSWVAGFHRFWKPFHCLSLIVPLLLHMHSSRRRLMSFYHVFIGVARVKKRLQVRVHAPHHLTNHSVSNRVCSSHSRQIVGCLTASISRQRQAESPLQQLVDCPSSSNDNRCSAQIRTIKR